MEELEDRRLLASDFGDAPPPYPTLLLNTGAEHALEAGLSLGAAVDAETDGQPTPAADGDGPDDDGVTFGLIRVGQLGSTVTVNVQGAAGKLDAWIDFNRDGNWGGPGEQIFALRNVAVGDNNLTFDVPNFALAGTTYARFRLSTAGGLGPSGPAADGEVEDYLVAIADPTVTSGIFGGEFTISTAADSVQNVFAADVDGDGDMDVLSASPNDNKIAWYENNGNQAFTEHVILRAWMWS